MKDSKYNIPLKNIILGFLAVGLAFSLTSCAQKLTFLNSKVVPAAEGTVKVKQDSNKNYDIKIDISNLAEPERLQPPKKMYIVWMLTDQEVTKNIGQIKTSSNMLSKTLKASFETVSSFKPAKIFITAEDDPNAQSPGWGDVVLSTNEF